MSLLFGVACPLGDTAPGSVFVAEDDLPGLGLKGKKLKLEHQKAYYGRVLDCWADTCPMDRKRKLYVLAKTDDTFAGRQCDKLLRRGDMREFSLGHRVDVDKETMCASNKRAIELSIVRKGAREGCHIMHVAASVARPRNTVNINSSAVHKCTVPARLAAGRTMSSGDAMETTTTTTAATPTGTTATDDAAGGRAQIDVLTARLAEREEADRIAKEEKEALVAELGKMQALNKRFQDGEDQRMQAMKDDWIKTLQSMFAKNGDKVPTDFEQSVNALSETQHRPFVDIMCSVTKYQKSTGKEIEELRGQLEVERAQKKQINEQSVQKDGTIQALRTVQNTHTKSNGAAAMDTNVPVPLSTGGVFAGHGARFQPLPTMGEYGRVMPQRPGAGMKEKYPEIYASIAAAARDQQGMDFVQAPRGSAVK